MIGLRGNVIGQNRSVGLVGNLGYQSQRHGVQ
jgi:hypothetical protein